MTSLALPLIEMDIDCLNKVIKGEMELEETDIYKDIDILEKETNSMWIKVVKKHIDDAKLNYKNRLMVSLELGEAIRYLRKIYRSIGFSISPKGEKRSIAQLMAIQMMGEIVKIRNELTMSLKAKLEMAKIFAKYEVESERMSKQASADFKEAAKDLADDNAKACLKHLFDAQKALARFILIGSG